MMLSSIMQLMKLSGLQLKNVQYVSIDMLFFHQHRNMVSSYRPLSGFLSSSWGSVLTAPAYHHWTSNSARIWFQRWVTISQIVSALWAPKRYSFPTSS